MATLSLNTSITSTHKTDLYTVVDNDGNYDWANINLYGNYFTDTGSPTPCEYMTFDGLVNGFWIGVSVGCDLCGYYSYAYCNIPHFFGYYYDFSDPNNSLNYYFLEKAAVMYGGLGAESFINRTTVNIKVTDTLGVPLQGASVTIMAYNTNFIIWTDKSLITNGSGIATTTFLNPPISPWQASLYRTYYILAGKSGYYSAYKDETIPNQQTYPSSGYVTIQLPIGCAIPTCNLTLT